MAQDHPQVVPGPEQEGVQRVAISPLEPVLANSPLAVSNGMDAPTRDGIDVPEWKCQPAHGDSRCYRQALLRSNSPTEALMDAFTRERLAGR